MKNLGVQCMDSMRCKAATKTQAAVAVQNSGDKTRGKHMIAKKL